MRSLLDPIPVLRGSANAVGAVLPVIGVLLAASVLAACSAASTGTDDPAATGGSGEVLAVTVVDYAFEPSSLSATAGEVTFRVTNAGTQEHEFELFRDDIVVDEVEGLVPGLTRELTTDLSPGTYTYVCKLADHEQRGMSGTLTIEP